MDVPLVCNVRFLSDQPAQNIVTIGIHGCFALNGVSFIVVIIALMSLHIKHIRSADRKPILQEMRGGLAYARITAHP